MPPTGHALLGASKSHQWLECPPSARFEEQFEAPPQSEAAAEGTLAHALAEDHLRKLLDGKKVTTPKKLKSDPLYRPAMEEHVATYCDVILETLTAMREAHSDPIIYLEQPLDLSRWIPEGFGTADCILIGDGTLHVFDFKYGKGVPVAAEENPQLKLYGLGALNEFECLYEIREVVLHIIQPRLDSITEWSVSRDVLAKWGEFVVKPIAEKAFKGEGEYNPGESQCRWCLAKNRCRAYNAWLLDTCQLRFTDQGEEREPNELSDKEIAEILGMAEEIKKWVTNVTDYAKDQALNHGVHFPGYKLVEGPSRRKITDEQKVIDILRDSGYTTEQVCKLKGITDLEELTGKKCLQQLIGEYIVKPQGNPTLAPETDKRKPYGETKFTEVEEKQEL
jgi:hypothetical protein